jgi:hypothetical protein
MIAEILGRLVVISFDLLVLSLDRRRASFETAAARPLQDEVFH